MSFPKGNLNESEQVVLDLRPHWWFFMPQVVVLVIIIAVGILSLVFGLPGLAQLFVAALILAALAWFAFRYVVWTTTRFVITSDRLINRTGVLRREGIEIPLERVNTVFFKQTIFERMIGMGDLEIESAGEQGAQRVSNIASPLAVQNEIYTQMEGNENRKFDRIGSTGAPTLSIPEQIEKLAELHRQGVLSDAEFQASKAELLGRL
ncbi:MAG: PH domain-containing protein [Actinomycetota bacterium]